MAVSKKKAVAKAEPKAMTQTDLPSFEGEVDGFEELSSKHFAIPFLRILQKSSPEVDETVMNGARVIEDAKAGMLFNTVTKELYDGKEGVGIIVCYARQRYLRWEAGQTSGGFKGVYRPDEVEKMISSGEVGMVGRKLYVGADDESGDFFQDVMEHYLMVQGENGMFAPALTTLTSTQMKKSAALLSQLNLLRVETAQGRVRPPMYYSLFRATTVPESNEKGSWFGWVFERQGSLATDSEEYIEARRLSEDMRKDLGRADYAAEAEREDEAAGGF